MPRRHYEKRLVRATPVKQPGRVRDTGGFHTLPRAGLIGNCILDPIDEFDAAFLCGCS
jgi:hypothetical protein